MRTPSAPKRSGQALPESWYINEREDLSEPIGSWKWMQNMAMIAPLIRSRLRASSWVRDSQELSAIILPIGAALHCDLMQYELLYHEWDDWSRRFLDALEEGEKPATAYMVMGESRTTSWRRQRERKAA